MIIVSGTFEVDPAQRDAFLAERLDRMRASRAEAGCLDYTFSADPLEPGRVVLFERWEDQASLDAHLAGPRWRPRWRRRRPRSCSTTSPASARCAEPTSPSRCSQDGGR